VRSGRDQIAYREDQGQRAGAKVEYPFKVIKRHFGHVKVRYRGMAKNTSQLLVMFDLSNQSMVHKLLIADQQERASMWLVRPQVA
jgi:IS5 family transposase